MRSRTPRAHLAPAGRSGGERSVQADATEVEAPVPVGEDELRRASAHVDDERARTQLASGCHAAEGEACLLVAGKQARVEAIAPLDLAEEGLAVLGVSDGARRHRQRALHLGRLR